MGMVRRSLTAPASEDGLVGQWSGDLTKPLVSVCCITYNQKNYIAECLESILGQRTNFPFEVLVHDDASDDGTAEQVAEYARRFPTVIRPILQKENQWSLGRNINPEFNFLRAKGRYIAICEGDDAWVDPTKLQQQVDFLEANPEFVMCFTDAVAVDESGRDRPRLRGARRDLTAQELQLTASIFTLTTCFRNVICEWPREFANVRYGDLAIWSLLGDHGAAKYLPNIAASRYRQHDAGIHSGIGVRRRRERALETMAALFSYRLRLGQRALALRHLEDILLHSLGLLGARGLVRLVWRGVRRSIDFDRK
jgi:glycosyltransferase involved in cell wall biosynthesis